MFHHNNPLAKTYYTISHSIIYLIDEAETSTIDDFFPVFNKVSESGQEAKVSVVYMKCLSHKKSISSFEIKENFSEKKSKKSSAKNLALKSKANSTHSNLVFVDKNKANIAKIKGFMKIYKIVALYVDQLCELSVQHPNFLNFLGYLLLNKMRVQTHVNTKVVKTVKTDVNTNDFMYKEGKQHEQKEVKTQNQLKLLRRMHSYKG